MNDALSAYSELAWAQFWQVTIVAAAALVIVRLFCRRRPHLAYAVLLIVAFKCLTPPLLGSRWGVFSWTSADSKSAIAARSSLRDDQMQFDEPPDQSSFDGESEIIAPSIMPAQAAFAENRARQVATETPASTPIQLSNVLLIIWMAGTLVAAGTLAIVWLRQIRFMRSACRPAGGWLVEFHRNLARRLGVRRRVRLWISAANHGPLAFGVLRPSVVLPENIEHAAKSTIEPLLAHELIHIRRGDTLVGPLQALCAVLWWFHPLIWIVNRSLSRQRERCCDEEVLGSIGCNPETYAQGLVHVLREQRRSLSAMLAVGVRSIDVTKERLELIMIARKRLNARTPVVCWCVLLLGAALVIPGRGLMPTEADAMQQSPPATAQEAAGKLSNSAAQGANPVASPPSAASNAAQAERARRREPVEFEPVLERTINDDNPQLGNFLIDLDTGKLFSPPPDISGPNAEKAIAEWISQQGIDAMGEGDMLLGFDIIVIPKAQMNWDPLRGNFEELNAGRPGTPVPIVPHGRGLPATYYFRTREGSSGVLQIVETNGNSTKIRYKLAKKEPAAPAQDAAAAAAAAQERNREIEESVRTLIDAFTQAAKNNNAEAAKPLFVEAARNLPSVADFREIAAEGAEPDKIATVVVGVDTALAISDFFDSSRGVPNSRRRHCMVYTCVFREGKWLISDIDLEPVAGLVDEVNRFVRRSLQPQSPK
jgi:beta-lactamase regulating signal transducer with metallopeptidase domain/ribosomal protein S20